MASFLAFRHRMLMPALLLRRILRYGNFLPCPLCLTGDGGGKNSFCPECLKNLPLVRRDVPLCPGCGCAMDGALAFCSQCLKEPLRPWRSAIALMEYRGNAKDLIRDLKFHGHVELAHPLGELAARAVRHSRLTVDALVPVPLHWTRYLTRSYNQAELFAEQTAELLKLPLLCALKRRWRSGHQSRRNRAARHSALKGVFYVPDPRLVQGKTLLLVDDVLTTGSTLSAAANALLKAGAAEIHVLCCARTLDHRSLRNALRFEN